MAANNHCSRKNHRLHLSNSFRKSCFGRSYKVSAQRTAVFFRLSFSVIPPLKMKLVMLNESCWCFMVFSFLRKFSGEQVVFYHDYCHWLCLKPLQERCEFIWDGEIVAMIKGFNVREVCERLRLLCLYGKLVSAIQAVDRFRIVGNWVRANPEFWGVFSPGLIRNWQECDVVNV